MQNICHFIASHGLGRGEFYIDLVNEMVEHDAVNLTLVVPSGSKFLPRVNQKINVIEYTSKNTRNNPLLFLELYGIFQKNRFDVVHTHFAKATEIFHLLNKLLGVVHIATKHNPRKGKIFNKMANVTAVSADVAKSIRNDNVKVIYNGLRPQSVTKKSVENEIFTMIAVGRLDKIKGFDILIKECAKLNFEFLLEIVGDGEERDTLQALIESLALQEKVKLLGFRHDIPQMMQDADLVVMSSHSEGFSLVMVEALFYANLFITTRVSGAIEILDEMFFIDGFDIARKLQAIHEEYDRFHKGYMELAERIKGNFLLDNIVDQYLEYYEAVCLKGKQQ